MEIAPGITVDERVRFGRPVISGTRVSVDLVLGKLAGGMTYDEIVKEYDLTVEDILACWPAWIMRQRRSPEKR
jgi:uncharacterized protein (DUF433 family)